jgi:hypothetical protein
MTKRCLTIGLIAATLGGCAQKKPEPTPTPVETVAATAEQTRAAIEAQTGTPVNSMTITFVDPPDDVFVGLIVAAAGWARGGITARSIGILQAEGAEPRFRRAVEAVNQRYALRPIAPSDFTVVCGNSQTSNTSRGATSRCSMKYVDAVLAFNAVRVRGDAGYVGLDVTRVPAGADRVERTFYCITMAKTAGEWKAKKSERVVDPQRCIRNWA